MQKKSKLIIIIALVAVIIIAAVIIIPGLSKNDSDKSNGTENSFVNNSNSNNVAPSQNDTGYSFFENSDTYTQNINIGDTYIFGTYEQDGDTSNGQEPLEWIVLDKKGSGILVISKYVLDNKLYHDEYMGVTWETCSLRAWLNDTFINTAFSEKEIISIPTVTITPDEINPNYKAKKGNATADKIFLLSVTEASTYFASDELRKCAPTEYAEDMGVFKDSYDKCSKWWLRTPGEYQTRSALVWNDGHISYQGEVADNDRGVRPSMWIDLAS